MVSVTNKMTKKLTKSKLTNQVTNQLTNQVTNQELIDRAKSIAKVRRPTKNVRVASVGCALVTTKGNIFLGVNIHADCDIGFCSEHSAIASMVMNKEYAIKKIVAVHGDTIYPPCGRCRELIYQISSKNKNTEIILEENKTIKLKDLLPDPWEETIPGNANGLKKKKRGSFLKTTNKKKTK
ncbi:MAG: cytidine deaminase family protein [Candidatus Nanoarchaeia archaeon]